MSEREKIISEAHRYLILNILDEVTPVVVSEAKGTIIRDIDGREYIDLFSGIAVMNIGYSRDEIIEAVTQQIKKYAHISYYYYVPILIELAKKLASIMPSKKLTKSFFGNSGAEANECALKLARKYTRRYEFIALAPSFHGRTLATLSVTGQGGRKRNIGPLLPGVIFVPAPYCYRSRFADDEEECGKVYVEIARDLVREASTSSVAALIIEPVLGEPGIIPLPRNYLRIFKEEILDKYNALLIVDEVQTGFGRTGRLFGIEHFNIEPDIVTTAKALGGGLPISACTTTEEIASAFEPGDHFSTFGGNPVSAAAAIKTIDIILREELHKKAWEKGIYVMKRLEELKQRHRVIGDVRGLGLMIGVELVRDEKKTPATNEAKRVKSLMREFGFLIGVGGIYGNVIRIQPPLVISYEELDKAIEALDKALELVEK
ncbi:MAG: aspartate aminotransferase family protein [Sulfolobales archaeon]